MKKNLLILSSLMILSLASCGGSSSSSETFDKNTYYEKISSRVKFDQSNENNFYEDMKDGLDDDTFYTLDGAWHTNVAGGEHNGVRSRNLFYVQDGDDTYLAIKGRGKYNKEDASTSGLPEGGCIVTKNHLGPGRYEIEMACMPREGGVNAMWTYCTTTGSEETSQNEIDIEIGGTTSGENYRYLWTTSWTKKTNKKTDTIDVSDITYMNDGKIHKYTFDWYTSYPGTSEGRVDWFVDGIYINSISDGVIPDHEMPLWIGLWFPPLWAGNASFDTDYMLIDTISYTAFDTTQYYETCRSQPGYDKKDPSKANIGTLSMDEIKNVNKLANGTMEDLNLAVDNTYYGWSEKENSSGKLTLGEGNNDNGYVVSASEDTSLSERKRAHYIYQTISGAYPGYQYQFKGSAKLNDENAKGAFQFIFVDKLSNVLDSIDVDIESTNFEEYVKDIEVPSDTTSLIIRCTSNNGSVSFDDLSLIKK